MKWEEVRNIYPNKFVLLRSLGAHIEDNKKYIDDVAVVKFWMMKKRVIY